jgi:putative polyketide hydroxylase
VGDAFPGLELTAHVVGGERLRDPEGRFATAWGLASSGAALVRPDGFVAWRARSLASDPAAALRTALQALLMKA